MWGSRPSSTPSPAASSLPRSARRRARRVPSISTGVAPDGFSLVDLPGYGYAKCSQEERKSWAKLIEYYLTNTPTLKALALLLDCRIPPQALDRDLADFARGHGIPLLPVLTKADKCTQVERSKRQQEWSRLLNGIMPLPVSSKDMRGVDALWSELRRFAGTGESVSEEE